MGSRLYGLESYCDALVDEVWMVKEDRVIISLRRVKDGIMK